MAETFYGPWRVVLALFDPYPQQGFVISGSDNADGFYVPEAGVPVDIAVAGEEWTIGFQMRLPHWPHEWVSAGPIPTTQFLAGLGWTVRLSAHGGYFGPHFARMALLCISMDPDINPIPTPNPFDFTIPEG